MTLAQPAPAPDIDEEHRFLAPDYPVPLDPIELLALSELPGDQIQIFINPYPPQVRIRTLAEVQALRDAREHDRQFKEEVELRRNKRAAQREADRQDRREALESSGEPGWSFRDLREAYKRREEGAQQPEIGRWCRTLSKEERAIMGTGEGDGHGILYRSKVNLLFGPSESGKSMIAYGIIAQEVLAGRHVVILDFEDDADGLVTRMVDLGLTIDQIAPDGASPGGIYYISARLGMEEEDFQRIKERVDAHKGGEHEVSLVLIDAATEAMATEGLNPDKAVEVAQWGASMPRRFAMLGPGVLLIDHTGLSDTDRAQGSQHKKSMIDGVSLKVSRKQAYIRGRGGASKITVAKDRIGSVRQQSLPAKPGEMEYRGTFVIRPDNEEGDPFSFIGRNPLDLDRPVNDEEAPSDGPVTDVDEVIEEVLRVVAENPGAGKGAVRHRMEVKASSDAKYAAIDDAIRLGLIRTEKGARGRIGCHLVLPEKQLSTDDLTSPATSPEGSSSPHDQEGSRSTSPHDQDSSGELKGETDPDQRE